MELQGLQRCICGFYVLVAFVVAQPQFDHRTLLGLGTPSSDPDLDEVSGAFEIKVVARTDDISRRWQRLFQFGTVLESDGYHTVSLSHVWAQPDLRFQVHSGIGSTQELYAHGVVDEGVVTTWTVGVDETLRMYIKKNGVEVASRPDGKLPAAVSRPIKYIGRSFWAADDDHVGAVLGIQFVKGGNSSSVRLPLEWMNYPGQLNGSGFVVSGYARFNDVVSGSWQRVFDFSDGSSTTTVNLGQRAASRDLRLEVNNGGTTMVLDANDTIVDQEMAFWEVGIAQAGLAWIRKNGNVVASDASFQLPIALFRHDNRFGYSHNPSHDPLNGVVLGVRIDREADTS